MQESTNIGGPARGAVEAAVARARVRWPGIGGSAADLAEHVEKLHEVSDLERFGDELYLACVCCKGDAVALRVLDREYIARVSGTLSRFRAGRAFIEDTVQELRHKLLLPPEPRLMSYAATGPLRGWLRVVIVRLGLDLRRGGVPQSDEALIPAIVSHGPAEAMDVHRYRGAITDAIKRAFAQLLPDERTLLRLHHIDGVSLDQLGVLDGVHRATVARRLAELRLRVLKSAEVEIRAHHGLSKSELRSMFRRALSTLDAHGILAESAPTEP